MNILSIGNSFSQDAHKWLHRLAEQNGVSMETVNLYIGGCSLETHHKNLVEDNALYALEINGGEEQRKISISEALKMRKWDVVTLQQVSQLSGLPQTYEPYLSTLADCIRRQLPDAQIFFHQTWAYETDSTHSGFANYGSDQMRMYQSILAASSAAAERIGAKILPVGRIIQEIRQSLPEFDYENGGQSLCRDGFHLSLDYGRYAAAAVWIVTLTGKPIALQGFENFDSGLLHKITDLVNRLCLP